MLLKCGSKIQEPISSIYDAQFRSVVVHNLTRWILEKNPSCKTICSMIKGNSPQMSLCSPSNFEGDGLHLKLLKNTSFFGSSSIVMTKFLTF